MPSIFDYYDYRAFLQDSIDALRAKGKFSVRTFAAQAGFKSIGFLTMVIKRQRNLSIKSSHKVADALKLSRTDADFFEKLVLFDQAETMEEKDLRYQDLLHFHKFRAVKQVDSDQYEFFAHWYVVATLEALGTKLARKGLEGIATALKVELSKVEHAIEILSRLKLIERKGDHWRRLEPSIQTEHQIKTLSVRKFHREMIGRALETIDGLAAEDRELGALTISLSASKFQEVRRRIFQFQQDLNALYSDEADPEKIYQLNIQFFPLAVIQEKIVNEKI